MKSLHQQGSAERNCMVERILMTLLSLSTSGQANSLRIEGYDYQNRASNY
jgi:hypothetical protein